MTPNILERILAFERKVMANPDLQAAQKMFASVYPKYFIEGPYTPLNKVLLPALSALLLYTRTNSFIEEDPTQEYKSPFSIELTKKIYLAGAIYGMAVMRSVWTKQGPFVYASYTMQSWSWTTLRFILSFLALQLDNETVEMVADKVRFISLVQNVVTFTVWWFLLFPLLTSGLAMKNRKNAIEFVRWNFSYFLLTVHGINLPFALLGHLLQPRQLVFNDLWIGWGSSIAYLAFYLGVLDRIKMPLYAILTPRSFVGSVSYIGIMGLYYGIFRQINALTPSLLNLLN